MAYTKKNMAKRDEKFYEIGKHSLNVRDKESEK